MYKFDLVSSYSSFSFGVNNCVADINIADGITTNINVTNLAENGVAINSTSVGGRTFEIKGALAEFNGLTIPQKKDELRNFLAPNDKRTLVVHSADGDYIINTIVESSPTFSANKNDGRFSFSLFAPFPFFEGKPHDETSDSVIGTTISTLSSALDKIPFQMEIIIDEISPYLTVYTESLEQGKQMLTINYDFAEGDTVEIYHLNNEYFTAVLKPADPHSPSVDITEFISDDSNLFFLHRSSQLTFGALGIGEGEGAEHAYRCNLRYKDWVASLYDT